MKANLLARLRAVGAPMAKSDARFKTAAEWAAEWGLGRARASDLIRRGIESGVMEMKKFPRKTICGSMKIDPHYAEVK